MKNSNTTETAQPSAAHTPGPWIKHENTVQTVREIDGMDVVVPIALVELPHPDQVGQRAVNEFIGELHANARLIAAAPELLEALNVLLAYVEDFGAHTNDRRVTAARFAALEAVGAMDPGASRAAIAKAEGRA